jgi:hypothetical protein
MADNDLMPSMEKCKLSAHAYSSTSLLSLFYVEDSGDRCLRTIGSACREAGEHWLALVEVRVAKIEAQKSTILWNSPCAGWLNDSSMIAREGPVSSQ